MTIISACIVNNDEAVRNIREVGVVDLFSSPVGSGKELVIRIIGRSSITRVS
jgi:hypothetical protein